MGMRFRISIFLLAASSLVDRPDDGQAKRKKEKEKRGGLAQRALYRTNLE